MENIGVTLVFAKNHFLADMTKGIMASFVIPFDNFENILLNISSLAKKQVERRYKGYTYLGVSDMFLVDIDKQSYTKGYLGRTSHYNIKSYTEAYKNKMSSSDIKKVLENIRNDESFNVSYTYYHKDLEGDEYNFSFTINSVLNKIVYNNLKNINDFGKSDYFINKILKMTIEEIYPQGLVYIGISDIFKIKNDGFQEYYSDTLTLEEIKKEVLLEKDLYAEYNECVIDSRYIG